MRKKLLLTLLAFIMAIIVFGSPVLWFSPLILYGLHKLPLTTAIGYQVLITIFTFTMSKLAKKKGKQAIFTDMVLKTFNVTMALLIGIIVAVAGITLFGVVIALPLVYIVATQGVITADIAYFFITYGIFIFVMAMVLEDKIHKRA